MALEFVPLAFIPSRPSYDALVAEDAWAEFYATRAENAPRLLAYLAELDRRGVGICKIADNISDRKECKA